MSAFRSRNGLRFAVLRRDLGCWCVIGLGGSLRIVLLLPTNGLSSLRFSLAKDKREGGILTTKWSPMWAARFLSTVWMVFFAAYHVAATTTSPSFFPQVSTRTAIASRPASFHLTRFRHSNFSGRIHQFQFRYPSPVQHILS